MLAMEPHFHSKLSLLQVAASTPEVSGYPCGESVPSSSATTLVSCQATRCERLALCRQLILSAKWAAATPVAALPLAGHQQALTGNNNDLTFATRL